MFVSDEQNNEQDNDSGCKNFVPSTCKLPSTITMESVCEDLARNLMCNMTWNDLPPGRCDPTPGYIKDGCKVSCKNCKGKHLILFANLQILLF